jgi:hypothetical protein
MVVADSRPLIALVGLSLLQLLPGQFTFRHLLDADKSAALLLAQSRSILVPVDKRMAKRIGPLTPIFATLDQIGYRLSDALIRDALSRTNED